MDQTLSLPAPDRRIDIAVHRRFRGFVLDLPSGPVAHGEPIPRYSSSLDAVIDLISEVLPGWEYCVSTRSGLDNAWLMPDALHPELGPQHLARWPDETSWLDTGPALDASFAPSPRGAMALLSVLIEVHDALSSERAPLPDVSAAFDLVNEALEPKPQTKRPMPAA